MKRSSLKIDYWLLFVVIVLVVLGTIVVYSASFYELEIGFRDPPDYHYKQMLLYATIGIGLMIFTSFVPYEVIKKLVPALFLVTVISLFAVIFFGEEINGAKRWIKIQGFTFMPSELAKISIVFIIAWYADKVGSYLKDVRFLAILLGVLSFLVILVIPQRDLATVVIMLALMLTLLWISNIKKSHLFAITGLGIGMGTILLFWESYRGSRVKIWMDTIFDRNYLFSDERRQIMNSIYAISSGGIRGRGLGFSEFSNMRLSEAYSDFVFAIFAEEFGFVGSLILLLLYALLLRRIFKIAFECEDLFGFLIAAGTGLIIAFHVLISVGVALAILPTTGIALPFISKGGSSLVILMMMVGVVLNISSHNNEKKAVKRVEGA